MSAAARPIVNVHSENGSSVLGTVALPAIFKAAIRSDIVNFVHSNMAKNKRQPIAVSTKAGHQTSAESWGTGRAVARIPRVGGGGTHRAGQGAFGNMCRGGRMFAPTKVFRKWHVKLNQNQKRHATASAVAATAVPALVMARGHKIDNVQEIPLVIGNGIESLTNTKPAIALLKAVNAYTDVERVIDSKTMRAGQGKARNRRFRQRRGPLIIYKDDNGICKAFRNVPGVELCDVRHLNLLTLAPGGHLGRFVIWSQGAFESLDSLWGTFTQTAEKKSGYNLMDSMVSNPDITRIINSDEIQSVLRAAKPSHMKRPWTQIKNPLKNQGVMTRLNPYAVVQRRNTLLKAKKSIKKKLNKKRASKKFVATLLSQ